MANLIAFAEGFVLVLFIGAAVKASVCAWKRFTAPKMNANDVRERELADHIAYIAREERTWLADCKPQDPQMDEDARRAAWGGR